MNLANDYYRCIKTFGEKCEIKEGEVYIVALGEKARVRRGDHYWDMDLNTFHAHFSHETGGLAARMSEVSLLGASSEECTDLAVLGLPTDLTSAETRTAVTTIRRNIEQQLEAADKQVALAQQIANEMMYHAQDKLAVMNRALQNIEGLVNGLNAYLGVGEDVVTISYGDPAPVDCPTIIRQLVLFADEECVAHVERGGIDFKNLDVFDQWLRDPKNRDTVLPETRCIVAMRTRRTEKEYSENALRNTYMNKANFDTFFLVRNGDRVYRVHPEIIHEQDRLFPTLQEMRDVFENAQLLDSFGRPVSPGTREWVYAAKNSDMIKRNLLVTIMFLQGLFDRSDLLHPLPPVKINVAMPDENHLRVIRDGEMLLSDERPSFKEWLRMVNSRIRVGSRVVMNLYEASRRERRETSRVHQVTDRIFNVTEYRPGSAFSSGSFVCQFYGTSYRGRRVYDKVRIHADDDFLIDVDNLNEDDVRYYLSSRLHRHQYLDMFPLLRLVLALREAERSRDADFVSLAVSQLANARGENIQDVDEGLVVELLNWWKYKNQRRRAVDDDAPKALKMIMKYFGTKKKRWFELFMRPQGEAQALIDHLNEQDDHEHLLYVGFCGDNEYVALYQYAQRPSSPFVREVRIKVYQGEFMKHEENPCGIVAWRHATWISVHETKAWKNFDHWAEDRTVLLPTEEPLIIERALERAKEISSLTLKDQSVNSWGDRNVIADDEHRCLMPLVCSMMEHSISVIVYVRRSVIDETRPLTGKHDHPKAFVFLMEFWKDGNGNFKYNERSLYDSCKVENWIPVSMSDDTFDRKVYIDESVVWKDDAALQTWIEDIKKYRAFKKTRSMQYNPVYKATRFLNERLFEKICEHRRIEHDKRQGSETAWKTIVRDISARHPSVNGVEMIIAAAIEQKSYASGEKLRDLIARIDPSYVVEDENTTMVLDELMPEIKL